jgi:Uma2 family endonuclease
LGVVHTSRTDPHGDDCLHLPKGSVRFPIEWSPADGFVPDDLSTWPQLVGRLEYVGGKIRYMPPFGDVQQDVCPDVITILNLWARSGSEFVVGGNEAGMKLGGDVRAADAAVWRLADVGPRSGRLRRVPPVLAVEVAGEDEGEAELLAKAQWYLTHGVKVVWIVLPDDREVLVVTGSGVSRYAKGQSLPEHESLPALVPEVGEFFLQLDRG